MTPADQALADQFVKQIMAEGKAKTEGEVIAQVEKNTPKNLQKSKGFWAGVWEGIKKLFSP